METGYAKMHRLDIEARADMIETVAGYEDDGRKVLRELSFAIGTLDENDPASLRWLACLIERRLVDIES
jgi:hypothetical protein